MCIYIYIYTHIHIHTHTHTLAPWRRSPEVNLDHPSRSGGGGERKCCELVLVYLLLNSLVFVLVSFGVICVIFVICIGHIYNAALAAAGRGNAASHGLCLIAPGAVVVLLVWSYSSDTASFVSCAFA